MTDRKAENLSSKDVYSLDGKTIIRIVARSDNAFSLEKYKVCYDIEEDIEYTVQEFPNPGGLYRNVAIAENEAKRLLSAPARSTH